MFRYPAITCQGWHRSPACSRNNPCPGSNLAPVGQTPARPNLASQPSQITQLSSAPSSSADLFDTTTPTTTRHISHPSYTGPIIKHIPRSTRPHIATELTATINNVNHNPDDPSSWSALLEFGSTMLYAPARTGRRHNLASVLKKRCTSSSKTITDHNHDLDQRRHRKANDEQCLATAVMTKIEDGNIKAAIRIITSDERPAADSAETLQALGDRHPPPPHGSNASARFRSTFSCTVLRVRCCRSHPLFSSRLIRGSGWISTSASSRPYFQ